VGESEESVEEVVVKHLRAVLIAWVVAAIVGAIVYGMVIYTVVHFVNKYW
jgi:hypothetical protein